MLTIAYKQNIEKDFIDFFTLRPGLVATLQTYVYSNLIKMDDKLLFV